MILEVCACLAREYMGEKTGRKKGLESRREGTVGKVRAYSTVPVSP